MAPRFVDLFAGVGGFSCGLEQAGWECAAAVEMDSSAAASFSANHPDLAKGALFVEDIRKVTAERLLGAIGLDSGELDLLVGGPPCQGFSTIGKRDAGDTRNTLALEYIRLLEDLKPKAFVLENVPGLVTFQNGKILKTLVERAKKAGYANTRFVQLDATTCGVPQKRVRVLVYGARDCSLPDLGDRLQFGGSVSVQDAIGDLPDPWTALQEHARGTSIPYGDAQASAYAHSLRTEDGTVDRWEPVNHTDSIVAAYEALDQGHTDARTKCYRLKAEAPARTLRAGCPGRTACRPVHPHSARVITVREAARLQSFPDDYVLPSTTSGAHRAIGNAVAPLMARSVGTRILEALQ